MTNTEGRQAHHRGEHSPTDQTTAADRAAWADACVHCARLYTHDGGFVRDDPNRRVFVPSASFTSAVPDDRPRPQPQGGSYRNGGRPVKLASPAQTDFIKKLIEKRDISKVEAEIARARARAIAHTLTSMEASQLIDLLKTQPFCFVPREDAPQQPATPAQEARKPWPQVAAGRYALRDVEGYANEVAFFRVSRPTDGPFAGRTFVKQFKSDEEMPVRGEGARKVLELIATDPRKAMELFGQLSQTCGHCGRRLTDDESRARGIGPTCAEKLGW